MSRAPARHPKEARPSLDIRTLLRAQVDVFRRLQQEGYSVVKRGWPTFLAYNPTTNSLRFIRVVNGQARPRRRGRSVALVDDWLRGVLGVEVERLER